MDILLQFGIFLLILGIGRLVVGRKANKQLEQAHKDRDKALQRLKELHR